ncbi:RNA-directed DNA polymerase [Thiorhodococcus fuscus]|uniref:RNA-directed DNA polymerase n=1 Tax=Thiorhodococcus fuscus TaxID=527200 RepID=A0ABW4YA90_9GAMM
MPPHPLSSTSTEMLSFPIDAKAVLSHMRQDMRDDWFPDAIEYKDLFANINDILGIIEKILLEGNGRYEGIQRTLCDIPKKGLGIRYSLETDFFDRFIYQSICTYLIPYFDPLLSPRVLSHRYNRKRKKEKYLVKPRIEQWRTFEGITYTAITGNQTLLATDLINCFENITVDIIRKNFESLIPYISASGLEKLRIRNAINTLCELLCSWGYSDKHGLPQNRDPSSFIANIVLNTIDHRMVELGYDYYRYVDDIRIICPDKVNARRALNDLIGELRTVGMNINSSKTRILTSKNSQDELSEFFPSTDDRSIAIDNMWRSRSRRVISRSAKYLAEILKECVARQETQSRQFRFAVNRLVKLVDSNIFDVQSTLASELLTLMIDSLEEHPASTDYYCRLINSLSPSDEYLSEISRFLCNDETAIHPWQNYHLWLTLARHNYKNEELISSSEHRLKTKPQSTEASAIFICLACVDECKRLIPVVPLFDASWPYQNQRFFLLSTLNLERQSLAPIIDKLGIKLRHTGNRATPHLNAERRPIADRETPSLLDLYDEISAYD